MTRPQQYRDVDVPEGFDEWPVNARVNFLCNALDAVQLADYLRERFGMEPRGEPQFLKDELAEILIRYIEEADER